MSAPASLRKSWVFGTRCVEMSEMAVCRAVMALLRFDRRAGRTENACAKVATSLPAAMVAVQHRRGLPVHPFFRRTASEPQRQVTRGDEPPPADRGGVR